MTRPIFLKNVPIDERRISHIERVVTRLTRRSVKKMVSLITPYPISCATFGEDIRGPVLCYMFPCEGTITKCLIDVGTKPKDKTIVNVSLRNKVYDDIKSYVITKSNFLVDLKTDVCSGDKLTVSIVPNEERVTEFWVSFLWVPKIKEVEAKSYLIDELEEGIPEVE